MGLSHRQDQQAGQLYFGLPEKKCESLSREMPTYSVHLAGSVEYGCSAWDPHQSNDIDKLERTQRRAARFITKDYKSGEPGSMTKMLVDIDLPTLESRRKENKTLLSIQNIKGASTGYTTI